MYLNHIGTSKFLVKSELAIDTNHCVVHRKVHCFLWLGAVRPNLFHVPCVLLCWSTVVQLMCSCVSASTAGDKEHTWQNVFQRQGEPNGTGSCSSWCVYLEDWGQGTVPASPVVLQEMNVSVLLPILVLIRASPASCWTRDQRRWISWGTWNMSSFLWAWSHWQPFHAIWMGCGRKQGRRKKTPGWFSLLESDSHSSCPRGEWFKPPVNDLFSNAKQIFSQQTSHCESNSRGQGGGRLSVIRLSARVDDTRKASKETSWPLREVTLWAAQSGKSRVWLTQWGKTKGRVFSRCEVI